MSASRVKVDRRLFPGLARDVEQAVTSGARPVVGRLATAIGSASGPSAYRRVYARLATGVALVPVQHQPPSIRIAGGGSFRGGGTISSLIWPYEYGHGAGDTSRTPRHATSSGRRRRGTQFPPRRPSGHWVGPVLAREEPRMLEGFARLVDGATSRAGRTGGVR